MAASAALVRWQLLSVLVNDNTSEQENVQRQPHLSPKQRGNAVADRELLAEDAAGFSFQALSV